MQATKTYFKTQAYGNDNEFMLARVKETNYGPGLPPTNSQCIMMNISEIE